VSPPGGKGRVILYMPHLVPPDQWSADYLATPPLSSLALGGPLRDAGYEVRLIDAKWEPDNRAEIAETVRGAVGLGISCLTGYSVKDGLEVATLAKTKRPELPVIWGGWHPSFCAPQAVLDPRVDVVVRDQGERSFVEVLDALREKRSLREIAGITYRDGEELVHTPDRAAENINHFPPPAYELVDSRRYVRAGPGETRQAYTIFSRGCPFRCDFCLDSRRAWLGLSLERIRAELEFWVRGHEANRVRFFDGNFFLGRDWLTGISHMIIDSDLAGRFQWSATGVANRVVRLDGELLSLLRRAGCHQVAIGAESGSEELLARITNKTTVAHTIEAVRLLTRHGINQFLFFMVGFPVEPEGALEDTLRLMATVKAINPAVEMQLNFCIPLPGSEMFRLAIERGLLPEPKEFADWAQHVATRPNLSHIGPAYVQKTRRFRTYLELAYPPRFSLAGRVADSALGRPLYAPLRQAALRRLERLWLGFPVEAILYDRLRALKARPGHPPKPASRARSA
jgi:radical SAM superfamily enzyme YgiQ (UPF0313 family)